MRLSILPFVLSVLTAVSASSLSSYPFAARRDLVDLLARQDQVPIPQNLTNAQLEAAYQAQCGATTTAIGQATIQADIANATANSLAISATFQDILNKLTLIDSENLNGGKQFAPTWKTIAQNWTNILWASRTTASNTAAYCSEFTTVIMPFVANLTGPIPISLSAEVLAEYKGARILPYRGSTLANGLQMADSLGSAAQATADAFTGLNNSIGAFTATFQNFALAQQSADQQSIDQLNSEIKSLQAKIAAYNVQITALAIALGATALGTAAGVALFPAFAPFIILFGLAAITGEATAFGVIQHERSDAQSQLNADQSQLAQFQRQLDQITAANSTLHSISLAAQTMGQQLGGFTAIWNAVKSDCDEVSQYLTTASTFDTGPIKIPQIFWATTNKVDCVYEALTTGLQDYAIGITNSGLPPPSSRRALGGPANFADTLHADVQALVASARAKAHKAHIN
ncbi:hypothetical protein DFH08DRAFT_897430 [Mycena albidolilacea]|uniref:Uncharacterized protein n=1 Tax=Mycena albidolilacea TaxID=1033008 RepID=A0AAD7ED57_9AGAR|nr:hypothetical protein DFH08DRAFT_897430 [Mycena albidolilacea]